MWKFQGSIEKEVESPGAIKKKSCLIPISLDFAPWNFQSGVTQFYGISKDKDLF